MPLSHLQSLAAEPLAAVAEDTFDASAHRKPADHLLGAMKLWTPFADDLERRSGRGMYAAAGDL